MRLLFRVGSSLITFSKLSIDLEPKMLCTRAMSPAAVILHSIYCLVRAMSDSLRDLGWQCPAVVTKQHSSSEIAGTPPSVDCSETARSP